MIQNMQHELLFQKYFSSRAINKLINENNITHHQKIFDRHTAVIDIINKVVVNSDESEFSCDIILDLVGPSSLAKMLVDKLKRDLIAPAALLNPTVKSTNLIALDEYVEQSWDFDEV